MHEHHLEPRSPGPGAFELSTTLLTLDGITALHTLFSTARGKQTDSNCADRKHICQLTLTLAASRHILKGSLANGKAEPGLAAAAAWGGRKEILKMHFSRTVLK